MQKRNQLLNKLLNSKAEEYFSFNNKIIKVNNLTKSDFEKLNQKTKNQIQADYLIIKNEVYFNKQSSSLAQSKLKFLKKVKAGEHQLTAHNNLLYKNLSLDLDKALDLLEKYKKNKHQQASFLHYDSDLLDYLPPKRRKLLLKLAAEASELGYNLYLVGGQVRDLLINIPLNKDLDILLEGDLKKFFVHLKNKYGYQYDYNNKFSTGFLHNQYGFSIDIASCREEKYHFPGSLPLVEKADLFSDLFRRDFTINTLVIDLAPQRSGVLYDFFGALNDLKNGILKVMHDYSFRDDPLRILRGIRFQILKDFKLSAKTIEISQRSLKNYDYNKLAVERVFTELSYLFKSKQDLSQFASVLLKEIPVLKLIKNNFKFSREKETNFLEAEKLLAQSRENSLVVNHFLVRLMILFYNSKESLIKSWPLSTLEKKIFINKIWENIDISIFEIKDPALKYRQLEFFKTEELIMFAVKNFKPDYIEEIFKHLNRRETLEIPISGHDLLNLGLKQGPEIKKYLLEVRDQVLRHQIENREEALTYLKKILKS